MARRDRGLVTVMRSISTPRQSRAKSRRKDGEMNSFFERQSTRCTSCMSCWRAVPISHPSDSTLVGFCCDRPLVAWARARYPCAAAIASCRKGLKGFFVRVQFGSTPVLIQVYVAVICGTALNGVSHDVGLADRRATIGPHCGPLLPC